jgi:hypothetical protein
VQYLCDAAAGMTELEYLGIERRTDPVGAAGGMLCVLEALEPRRAAARGRVVGLSSRSLP